MCCAAAAAAGLFTSLAFVGRSALRNPCLGALPQELASHDLVHAAWEGLDPNQVWDAHVHLLGTGDSGSGCSIHPDMHRWWHPVEFTRRHVMLNAACVATDAESIDRAYVQQLLRLAHDFPAGARWCLFAFEHSLDDTGRVRADWSTFHVPNEYAARVAEESGGRFEWVASVHPYREDALERLQAALRLEAVAVKWLPSAMNIDLRDPRCRPFYDALAASGVPLIVHCGEEQAVRGAAREDLGNPLLVRAPLEAGVRVVMAHAASLGEAQDLDRRSSPSVPAFDLCARLMDEPAWKRHLLADISAAFQVNRTEDVWRTLIARQDWHPRLMHGSDYPLPGIMPLHSTASLVRSAVLDPEAAAVVDKLREHNPLLADFVLKRRLRWQGLALDRAVFETRRHLASAATPTGDSTRVREHV